MGNEWKVGSVNLAGVQPFDDVIVDLPTGAYRVRVNRASLKQNTKSGKTSFYIDVTVTEGEHEGTHQLMVIGADMTAEGNRRSLKTALLSIGHDAAELESGAIEITAEAFEGRDGFIYVKALPESERGPGKYPDRRFISAERYEGFAAEANAEGTEVGSGSRSGVSTSTKPAEFVATPPPTKNGGLKSTLFGKRA